MKAAGYIRVSTAKQAEEGYSLDAQQKDIERYCSAFGWELTDLYIDAGKSGKNTERPELKRLMSDAAEGKFEKVVFAKLDRLGRSAKDILTLFDTFEKRDIGLVSLKEQFDTSTAMGRFVRTILAGVAELEREIITERLMGGKGEKVAEGGYVGGYLPYGYELIDGEIRIHDAEAQVIERIFTERQAGRTLEEIADGLTVDGIPTKRGGRWAKGTVSAILTNIFYTGRTNWNGIVEKASHNGIISDRVFNAVNE